MFLVYSKPGCSYCEAAKVLLTERGLTFNEMIVDTGQVKDPTKTYVSVQQLKQRVPTAQTVPQILDGDELVGGFDALKKYLG